MSDNLNKADVKHTPGPWSVHVMDSEGEPRTASNPEFGEWQYNQRTIGSGDVIVASTFWNSVNHGYPSASSNEEMLANTSLIAAAPTLLEALEGLEPFLDAIICYASTMDEHEPNRLVAAARAAIARAKGEKVDG